jgi:hypothetical protein
MDCSLKKERENEENKNKDKKIVVLKLKILNKKEGEKKISSLKALGLLY